MRSRWLHILLLVFFYLWVLRHRVLPTKLKYYITVFLKKYFSILHWSLFSFSLFRVNYNFCTWYFQSPFVHTNISYMYAHHTIHFWLTYLCLVCFQMHDYVIIFNQDSFYQAHTDHLRQLHHQCSRVFHLSHLILFLLKNHLFSSMLDDSIVLLLSFKISWLQAPSCSLC